MQKNLKSKKIIMFNSVVLLVLIVMIVVVNGYYLEKINNELSSIDAEHNQKLDIISQMSRIVRDRSLNMLIMSLAEDPWERDQQFMFFHKLAPQFINLRNKLTDINLTEIEKIELERALAFIRKTEPLQNDIVERIHSGDNKNVRRDIYEKDFPMESQLLNIFDDLIVIVRKNAQQAKQKAQLSYRRAMLTLIGATIIILFATILLMRKSLHEIQKIEADLIRETESLGWDATHDALTNIYNRRWLKHKYINLSAEDEAQHSFIYIDIDDFKPINDQYGHLVGDDYLKQFCREVEHCIRQNDTFARLGGDEFAILLENCNAQRAQKIAEKIHSRMGRFHLKVNEQEVTSGGISLGIYTFHKGPHDFEQMLQRVDQACYESKRGGKNQISIVNDA